MQAWALGDWCAGNGGANAQPSDLKTILLKKSIVCDANFKLSSVVPHDISLFVPSS